MNISKVLQYAKLSSLSYIDLKSADGKYVVADLDDNTAYQAYGEQNGATVLAQCNDTSSGFSATLLQVTNSDGTTRKVLAIRGSELNPAEHFDPMDAAADAEIGGGLVPYAQYASMVKFFDELTTSHGDVPAIISADDNLVVTSHSLGG